MIKNITRKDRKLYVKIVTDVIVSTLSTQDDSKRQLLRMVLELDEKCCEFRMECENLEVQLEVALADAKANKFKGIITPEDLESE